MSLDEPLPHLHLLLALLFSVIGLWIYLPHTSTCKDTDRHCFKWVHTCYQLTDDNYLCLCCLCSARPSCCPNSAELTLLVAAFGTLEMQFGYPSLSFATGGVSLSSLQSLRNVQVQQLDMAKIVALAMEKHLMLSSVAQAFFAG